MSLRNDPVVGSIRLRELCPPSFHSRFQPSTPFSALRIGAERDHGWNEYERLRAGPIKQAGNSLRASSLADRSLGSEPPSVNARHQSSPAQFAARWSPRNVITVRARSINPRIGRTLGASASPVHAVRWILIQHRPPEIPIIPQETHSRHFRTSTL